MLCVLTGQALALPSVNLLPSRPDALIHHLHTTPGSTTRCVRHRHQRIWALGSLLHSEHPHQSCVCRSAERALHTHHCSVLCRHTSDLVVTCGMPPRQLARWNLGSRRITVSKCVLYATQTPDECCVLCCLRHRCTGYYTGSACPHWAPCPRQGFRLLRSLVQQVRRGDASGHLRVWRHMWTVMWCWEGGITTSTDTCLQVTALLAAGQMHGSKGGCVVMTPHTRVAHDRGGDVHPAVRRTVPPHCTPSVSFTDEKGWGLWHSHQTHTPVVGVCL